VPVLPVLTTVLLLLAGAVPASDVTSGDVSAFIASPEGQNASRLVRLLRSDEVARGVSRHLNRVLREKGQIDDKQLATVLDYVGIGAGEGAKVLTGGTRLTEGPHSRGYFSSPAVLADVGPEMRVAQEEIFGPVLAVMPAQSLDHAIELANGIRFGLSAGVCTRSLTSAYEFINRIEAGLVMVNLPSAGVEYHVPFGGSKASSLGMREQGPVAVDFYSELQTAYVKY